MEQLVAYLYKMGIPAQQATQLAAQLLPQHESQYERQRAAMQMYLAKKYKADVNDQDIATMAHNFVVNDDSMARQMRAELDRNTPKVDQGMRNQRFAEEAQYGRVAGNDQPQTSGRFSLQQDGRAQRFDPWSR